jgi:hypothetical protein
MNDPKLKKEVNMHGNSSVYIENVDKVTYINNVRTFDKILLFSAFAGLFLSLYATIKLVVDLTLQGNLNGFLGRLITLALLFIFSGFCGLIGMKKGAVLSYKIVSSIFSYMYLAITCFTYLIVSWNVVYNYNISSSEKTVNPIGYQFQNDIVNVFSNPYISYVILLAAEILATVFLGSVSKINPRMIASAMIPFSLLNIMFIVCKYTLALSSIVPYQFVREIMLFLGMILIIVCISATGTDE